MSLPKELDIDIKDEYIRKQVRVMRISEMVLLGIRMIGDLNTDPYLNKDSKMAIVFRDVTSLYKGQFKIKEVKDVLKVRGRTLTQKDMEILAGPLVLATVEGVSFVENKESESFLKAQDELKAIVETAPDDVRRRFVFRDKLHDFAANFEKRLSH